MLRIQCPQLMKTHFFDRPAKFVYLLAEGSKKKVFLQVKDSEDSYLHEVRQRKEIEKTLARQRLEIDEMKRRCYALHDELQDSKKQKLRLEHHITQTESAAKDYVKELTDFFTEESCEETKKRRKLETDLLSEIQRVRVLLQES